MSNALMRSVRRVRAVYLVAFGVALVLAALPGSGQGNPISSLDHEGLSPLELEQRRLYQRIDALKTQKLLWREAWMRQDLDEANRCLAAKKLAPLERTVVLNSGGRVTSRATAM